MNRSYTWPIIGGLIGVYLLMIALPASWASWAPAFLRPGLHLGLDLQGGTQLDFRISEAEMEKQIRDLESQIEEMEKQNDSPDAIADARGQIANIELLRGNIVESIRTVLERRINSLGVSEAVITPSYYGDEKHLLVECPGVVDIQQCIATVGKTILLEFKEQFLGEDEEQIANMRALAEQTYRKIVDSGSSLQILAQDVSATLGVTLTEDSLYRDQLPDGVRENLWAKQPGTAPLLEEIALDDVQVGEKSIPHRGIFLAEVTGRPEAVDRVIENPDEAMEALAAEHDELTLKRYAGVPFAKLDEGYRASLKEMLPQTLLKGTKKDGTRTIVYVIGREEEREEISASHILVSYAGAARADATVKRTKEEAQALAGSLKRRLDAGEIFEEIARKFSDGPSAKDVGSLGTFSRGAMTPAFEQVAFALKKGEISDVVETEFGFHIIRKDSDSKVTPGALTFLELLIARGGTGDADGTLGQSDPIGAAQERWIALLKAKGVTKKEEKLGIRALFFSFLPTGWRDTPLDGKHFERATVTTDPLSGLPVVQIIFDAEGGKLFQELTKRNIGKPIAIFVGGELISAPTVQGEIAGGTAIITGSRNFDEANSLAQDLNTGAIPAPVHLVGQTTVEATLGQTALNQSLKAALFGFLLVVIYMIWYYRILGVIATIALMAYAIIFTAILKLPLFLFSSQHIVLTLAGVAGIILSIGMAVDANVLIFERMKEELAKGKLLTTAVQVGFKRSWPAIRDSNISTLITAGILFIIGTSIVRGFAVTLSIGILLSMFTAIVITRWLITLLYFSPIAQNPAAFGITPSSSKPQGAALQGK